MWELFCPTALLMRTSLVLSESILGAWWILKVSQVICASLCSGVSYIAPHLNNLYFLSLCRRCGVYAVVRGLFFLKLALSVVMLLAGPDQVYLLCIFIAR